MIGHTLKKLAKEQVCLYSWDYTISHKEMKKKKKNRSHEFCEICKNNFSYRTPLVASFDYCGVNEKKLKNQRTEALIAFH